MASRKTSKGRKTADEKLKMKRQHRQSFRLNGLEYNALMKYCKKYKVNNRARFLREAIMAIVLKKFDDDYPTLFDLPPVEKGIKMEKPKPKPKVDKNFGQLILDI